MERTINAKQSKNGGRFEAFAVGFLACKSRYGISLIFLNTTTGIYESVMSDLRATTINAFCSIVLVQNSS